LDRKASNSSLLPDSPLVDLVFRVTLGAIRAPISVITTWVDVVGPPGSHITEGRNYPRPDINNLSVKLRVEKKERKKTQRT
jgi:hypothetical protein